MPVDMRVLTDLGQRVLTIHVVDMSQKCKTLPSFSQLESELCAGTVHLHDMKRYHANCSADTESEIQQQRKSLQSQSGWDLFDSVEVQDYPRH